ncbi:retrovirus-related pol polyprotein from transposon TNT 1-94 [Tanacetum coccineum]
MLNLDQRLEKSHHDFQDSHDDEEDTRSSHEVTDMNLEDEYLSRALLDQSPKIFFKKGTQRFSIAKATDQTECYKCGKERSFARSWLISSVLPFCDSRLALLLFMGCYRSTTDPSVAVTDSSAIDYDSTDESLVCSTPLPPLKKLDSTEPISGPKTSKSILRSKSTFKAETLKGVKINEPSSALAKGNKNASSFKTNLAPAGKTKECENNHQCERTDHRTCDHAEYISTMNMSQHLKSLGRSSSRSKIPRPSKRFFPPCIHCGCIDHLSNECLYYPICRLCGSYDHDTNGHNMIISLEREINPRNPQHAFKRCEACGSSTHTTTDHYDIEWFKRGEALQAKKAEALKSTRAESSNANGSKTPTKSGCSRHMTGVKIYLHKYVEQPGLKVVFEDDSTCTTKVYGSIKRNGIFDEKRGTIFNSNKEVVIIALRVRDVYVLDITSSVQESCFFAKASENLNWLWHRRLAHLKFKTINKLAKQNLVISLSSLVYSKDKPCSSCKKGKHHRASFKTKQTSFIKKCLHLLHIDLFGPVTPRSINHEKYTLVIVDEYSRYTWVYFLKKKSQAPKTIMSFIKRVENQNDIKVKQLRTDNDESLDAIKFSKPLVDNINIAENERYPPDEYLHPYGPSQRYQTNNNDVSFIEPYECPELVVLETEVSSKPKWSN